MREYGEEAMGCYESPCPLCSPPHNAIGRGWVLKAVVWTAHWGKKEDTATTLRIRSTEEGWSESGQYISRADGKGWIACIRDGCLYRTLHVRETFNYKKEKTGLTLPSKWEIYISHRTRCLKVGYYWPWCSGWQVQGSGLEPCFNLSSMLVPCWSLEGFSSSQWSFPPSRPQKRGGWDGTSGVYPYYWGKEKQFCNY